MIPYNFDLLILLLALPTSLVADDYSNKLDPKGPSSQGPDSLIFENTEGNTQGIESQSILPPPEQTLSTSLFHTCAITHRHGVQDTCGGGGLPCGPVKCWGHNEKNQSTPPPGIMFTHVSCGGFFTCGLQVGGEVSCWGEIDHPPKSIEIVESKMTREELQEFRHARRMQHVQDENGHKRKGQNWGSVKEVAGGGYHIQVSSGMSHSCALSRSREVSCWGRNDYGESSSPSGKFDMISAGRSFTCGIRLNGAMKCWGKNDLGQSSPPPYPQYIFKQVSASKGGDHVCGILANESNDIVCWGDNDRRQAEMQKGPFSQVSAGTRTTCAIRNESRSTDGNSTSLYCWGSRANVLLDHFEAEQQVHFLSSVDGDSFDDKNDNEISGEIDFSDMTPSENRSVHTQISLGQDHACSTMVNAKSIEGSSSTSLHCWWMTGSDFGAHRVPTGLVLVV